MWLETPSTICFVANIWVGDVVRCNNQAVKDSAHVSAECITESDPVSGEGVCPKALKALQSIAWSQASQNV